MKGFVHSDEELLEETIERTESPMLESPQSSEDEESMDSDPERFYLVGCISCGETFERIADLHTHQANCSLSAEQSKSCFRYSFT